MFLQPAILSPDHCAIAVDGVGAFVRAVYRETNLVEQRKTTSIVNSILVLN